MINSKFQIIVPRIDPDHRSCEIPEGRVGYLEGQNLDGFGEPFGEFGYFNPGQDLGRDDCAQQGCKSQSQHFVILYKLL